MTGLIDMPLEIIFTHLFTVSQIISIFALINYTHSGTRIIKQSSNT